MSYFVNFLGGYSGTPPEVRPLKWPRAAQRAKFAKKVHKPPLWININNFELNGLDASIWISWSSSDSKKS